MSPDQKQSKRRATLEALANSLFLKGFFATAGGGVCPRTVSADDFGQTAAEVTRKTGLRLDPYFSTAAQRIGSGAVTQVTAFADV
jgi:hypothetical protein